MSSDTTRLLIAFGERCTRATCVAATVSVIIISAMAVSGIGVVNTEGEPTRRLGQLNEETVAP